MDDILKIVFFFNSTQTKMSCFATEWHSFLKFLWKPSPVHFLHDDVSSHLLLYYYTYIRLLLFDQLAERFGCCAAKGLYISVGTFTFQIITKWDLGMRDMLEDSWVEVFLQPFMFVYSVLGRVVLWQTVLSFGMSCNYEVFFTFMLFHVWFLNKVDRKPSASEIDFLYHSDSGIHIKNDIYVVGNMNCTIFKVQNRALWIVVVVAHFLVHIMFDQHFQRKNHPLPQVIVGCSKRKM